MVYQMLTALCEVLGMDDKAKQAVIDVTPNEASAIRLVLYLKGAKRPTIPAMAWMPVYGSGGHGYYCQMLHYNPVLDVVTFHVEKHFMVKDGYVFPLAPFDTTIEKTTLEEWMSWQERIPTLPNPSDNGKSIY